MSNIDNEWLNGAQIMAYSLSDKARKWAECYSPYEAEKARLSMNIEYTSELVDKYKDDVEFNSYVKMVVMLKEGE